MIQVELSASEIKVEPGQTVQLSISITNHQTHEDHLSIEIEGVDVEWYALPISAVQLGVGSKQTVHALFKPQRHSSSLAGVYPVVVRAKSLETGESGLQQATVIVQPFSSLQVEMDTRKIVSTFFSRSHTVNVTVTNMSNRDEHVDLYATDPDNSCSYEFEEQRLLLKPGHTQTVSLRVDMVDRQVIGSTRLLGFTVTSRSVEHTFVSSNASCQIERHAMLSVVALVTTVAVLSGLALFFIFRPKPLTIQTFSVVPRQINAGETVTVTWDVANASDGVTLLPENIHKSSSGSEKLVLNANTEFKIVARSGSRQVASDIIPVVVIPAAPPAAPAITEFSSSQKRIHEGETVTLTWKAEGVKTIVLNPLGIQKEWPLYTSQEVKPERTTTYVLAAQGPGGNVSRSITLEVVPITQSVADITVFKASKDKIITGQSTSIVYNAENAVSVDIEPSLGTNLKTKGKIDVSPPVTTTYTIRAADNKGNISVKTLTVTVLLPSGPPSNGANIDVNNGNQTQPPNGQR